MPKKLSEEIVSQILEKYNGYNTREISRKLGISMGVIAKYLKKSGIKLIPTGEQNKIRARKYPLNEDFFDVIDTQEKAYVLGLLYADGCNLKNSHQITISLVETDRHILKSIRDLICPTKPLRFIDNSNKGLNIHNYKNAFEFSFNSQHMSEQLTKLGCMPQKTHKLKFPTSDQVPDHLIHHFVRGYFDGDGCISIKNVCRFNFAGTENFLNSLQELLYVKLGMSKKKLQVNKSVYVLCHSNQEKLRIFRAWLYNDSIIHLIRKWDKFHSF